jgi:hypothetical protein
MNSIFRYIAVVSQLEAGATRQSQARSATPAPQSGRCPTQGCNYADNYYGDQQCGVVNKH